MADDKKDRLAAALSKATAARNKDRKNFIEADKRLTARREGRVGIPPPTEADIGTWQKMQQEVGKKRGFLREGADGKWHYEEKQKSYPERSAEKLVTGKIKRKKYPSVKI